MNIPKLLSVVALAMLLGACSGSNPAGPSSVAGATVNGSIVSADSGAAGSTNAFVSAAATPPGLQVSVVGTGISAAVNAAGQFTLKNVPPGLANLQFSAPGIAALLGLADVQDAQTVTIRVSLTTSSATLESDHRSNGREEQVEGLVESLPPTTAAGSLVVAGRTIVTDASTLLFLHGNAAVFADLAIGQRVHVKGQTTVAGLLASQINIQNTNTSTGLNFNGLVTGFSGTAAAFQLTVNGTLIKGDAATEFYGNSQFLQLVNGARVEVKGSQRDGFAYAVRIHVHVN